MDGQLVLAVDVGGSHVKLLASNEAERRRFESGPALTPQEMVDGTLEAAAGWSWDVVSVGIPTPIRGGNVIADPINLGEGWVGFGFETAFGKPTQVVNDAAMQAIGSYEGGRMLAREEEVAGGRVRDDRAADRGDAARLRRDRGR